jgi:hypothetical protein
LTVFVCANDNPFFSPNFGPPRAFAMNAPHDPAAVAKAALYLASGDCLEVDGARFV